MLNQPARVRSFYNNIILHTVGRRASLVLLCSLTASPLLTGCDTGAAAKGDAGGVSRPASTPVLGPNLTSNLRIGTGQRFIFAGAAQDRAYTASVENNGPVPVTVMRGQPGRPEVASAIVTLAPGAKAVQKFALGEAAIFENTAGVEATLIVKIWGNTDVGMRYEALRAMEAAEQKAK